MNQKNTFKKLLAGTAIILAALPFMVTFSAALTSLFNKIGAYVWLQNFVVPFEARLVVVLLRLVDIKGVAASEARFDILLERPGQPYLPVELSWNCLGWQSLILLGLTLITGLHGNWKFISKLETVVLGILGTFLVNLFRMAAITTLMYYWNEIAARVVHDYVAAFVALVWLIFFWWFSYAFVLEAKAG